MNRILKSIALCLSLIPCASYAAVDGLHVIYELEFSGAAKTGKVTKESQPTKMKAEYYIAEGQVRFENQTSENPLGNLVLIRKTKPVKSYMLFPKDKTYMEVPEMDMQGLEKDLKAQEPFKATGKKKEIAGYSCEVMARDLTDRHEEACTSSKLSKEYKNLQSALPKSKNGETTLPKGMEGFPLEYRVTRTTTDASSPFHDTTMTVSELRKTSLSASLFEVPNDYTVKSFPSIDPAALKGSKTRQGQQGVPADLQEKMKEMQKMMDEMKKKGTIQKK